MKVFSAALLCMLSGLAACGQTGPLRMPEDAPAKERYLIAKGKPKPVAAVPAAAAPSAAAAAPAPESTPAPPAADAPTP